MYVDDHVKALIEVVNSSYCGETFNIGGHNEIKNIDVVNKICNVLEDLSPAKPAGIKYYNDLISFEEDRPGHDLRYAIDASKISKKLNWQPIETFDSVLKRQFHGISIIENGGKKYSIINISLKEKEKRNNGKQKRNNFSWRKWNKVVSVY